MSEEILNQKRRLCLMRGEGDSLHYCIFKGINSQDLRLLLAQVPPRMTPKKRVTSITIPGRNGTLTQSDDTYDVFTREAQFVVMDLSRTQEICALYTGSGSLTFDDEPDRKYQARVMNELSPDYLCEELRDLKVQFECQPFPRELNPQKTVLTAPGVLYNIGTYKAFPSFKVYGSGSITLTVNGKDFTVQGVTTAAAIDCENLAAYEGQTLLVTAGEFPVLQLGKNTISFSGASKVEVTPNWRWL